MPHPPLPPPQPLARPRSRAALALVLALGPACAPLDDAAPGTTGQPLKSPCPLDDCGNGNSPVIDGVYFWSIHLGGMANERGVKYESARTASGHPMTLTINADQLIGHDQITNTPLTDIQLRGARLRVTVNTVPYQIRIADVTATGDSTVHFWIGGNSRVEAYELRYAPLIPPAYERPGPERPLCSLANADPLHPMIWAIAFTGDKYDPFSKDITLGGQAVGWVNFGCEDSALYKMHLVGYTTAATAKMPWMTTVEDEREALLNAWTMNACGTGTAFTKQGTPLILHESRSVFVGTPYQGSDRGAEAIWGPDRARCLTTPRVPEGSTLEEQQTAIDAECPGLLEPCSDDDVAHYTDHGYVLTAIPK